MERWQEMNSAPRIEVDDVRRRYRDWMSRAKQHVAEEERQQLHKCFDGGWLGLNDVETFLEPARRVPNQG
jgi:hypothetical protein